MRSGLKLDARSFGTTTSKRIAMASSRRQEIRLLELPNAVTDISPLLVALGIYVYAAIVCPGSARKRPRNGGRRVNLIRERPGLQGLSISNLSVALHTIPTRSTISIRTSPSAQSRPNHPIPRTAYGTQWEPTKHQRPDHSSPRNPTSSQLKRLPANSTPAPRTACPHNKLKRTSRNMERTSLKARELSPHGESSSNRPQMP